MFYMYSVCVIIYANKDYYYYNEKENVFFFGNNELQVCFYNIVI